MSAQAAIIIPKYGNPDKVYQSKYCIIWEVKKDFAWFPADKIYINKEFEAKLFIAFKNLEAKGLHTEINTFDGCFVQRPVRGMSVPSLHSWAMAIDLNAATEKLSQEKTNWTDEFVNTMESAGLYWGGTWHRKDSMHFALYNG